MLATVISETLPPNVRARTDLLRAARRLEVFTLSWNAAEAVVAILVGSLATSIALIGFGSDSLIECISGAVLLWRLASDGNEEREHRALKLVGWSFVLLAAYVAVDALISLLAREAPHHSVVGIALACVSLIVMPLLARAKRRVAAQINSRALHADSRQTDLCAYLSAILLAGLALNAFLGWWWADPAAALTMVPIISAEGLKALRGQPCDDCHPSSS